MKLNLVMKFRYIDNGTASHLPTITSFQYQQSACNVLLQFVFRPRQCWTPSRRWRWERQLASSLEKRIVLFAWSESHVEEPTTAVWWAEFAKSYKDSLSLSSLRPFGPWDTRPGRAECSLPFCDRIAVRSEVPRGGGGHLLLDHHSSWQTSDC
jgi:hypothetical protein